jgi:hypothetical protein
MDEMSSLDMTKNPMGKYAKCEKFLAYNEHGEIVGRVAAIINDIANRDWNHREVRFGWIDFIDDKEVSKALVDAVVHFGKKHGMTQISGPLGFTDFDNEGCVVEGFDDISSFNLKYNFPYYQDHFEALGLAKVNDWLEYRIFVPEQVPEKVSRAAALVQERYNLHIRRITKREVRKEGYGRKIFDLINRAYSQLFDFTVLPDDVIDNYVNTYLGLIDLKFITLIEDAEGKLVGVSRRHDHGGRGIQRCDVDAGHDVSFSHSEGRPAYSMNWPCGTTWKYMMLPTSDFLMAPLRKVATFLASSSESHSKTIDWGPVPFSLVSLKR